MGEKFIYLIDRTRCPGCAAKQTRPLNGNCPNCGLRLFASTDVNFDKFEDETNIAVWWAFDKYKGWVYRDHFMIPGAAPLVKRYEIPKLDANYGKTTTPAEVAAKGGRVVRHVKKDKMKYKGKILT